MVIKKELLDELLASVGNPQDLMGEDGEMGMGITIPRDRDATLEPQIIKKGQRRFEGFDFHCHHAVMEEVRDWQNRPSDAV